MGEEIAARTFLFVRTFDASRDLVYRIWTDPRYVTLWWGVPGANLARCELDVRVGGGWHIDMLTPDGVLYPNRGTYLEVVENERLVYDDVAVKGSPAWRGAPRGPIVHVVTFEDAHPERTRVSLRVCAQNEADRDLLARQGFDRVMTATLDRLTSLIAARRFVG
ncbi:MAG: SRPBCC domain-containing protein [Sphingomonas sp.]